MYAKTSAFSFIAIKEGLKLMMLDKYIMLFIHFQKCINQEITTSIEEISEVLFCTPRNSKSVLKKLADLRWIRWISGRGRGNKSRIVLTKLAENLIMERCRELVKDGEVKSARSIIKEYDDRVPNLVTEFNSWIDTLFGYNVEKSGSRNMDVLRLKLEVNPITVQLDPAKATLRSDRHIIRQVCDTLIKYNSVTKQFEPSIAFFWEYSETETSWYIYLNKGIRFHNGKELTAEDVIYAFSRFMDLEDNPYSWMLKSLQSVTAVDDYSLKFKLKTDNKLFLQILSDEHLSILYCPVSDKAEINGERFLTGTGPFKIIKNNDDILILEANDIYFKGRAFLDRVELWGAYGSIDPLNHVKNVEYDLCPKFAADKLSSSDFMKIDYVENSTQYLSINLNKRGPLKDIYFRKAFKGILNTQNMIKELGGERYEVSKGYIFSNNRKEEVLDCEDIKLLILKSGYKDEILNLYTYDHGTDHYEDAGWIKRECEKFGIKINTKFLSSDEIERAEIIKEADIIHDSSTLNDSLEMTYLDILLSNNSFVGHHLDPDLRAEVDEMVRLLYKSQEEMRIEILQAIENKILSYNNVIPLYKIRISLQSHDTIKNVFINTFGWIDLYKIWFKKKVSGMGTVNN